MTDKELRRMSRADLIEIIYEVRKNEAELQKEIEDLKKQLEERQKKVSKAGSLAELSAQMNGLFESAQATADQYLQEISKAYEYSRSLQSKTERRAAAIAAQALEERKALLEQTKEECLRIKENAAGRPAYKASAGSPEAEKISRRRQQEPKAASRRISPEEAEDRIPEKIPEEDIDSEFAQEELADMSETREIKPRKKTSPPRKSARPASMYDRRKMQ